MIRGIRLTQQVIDDAGKLATSNIGSAGDLIKLPVQFQRLGSAGRRSAFDRSQGGHRDGVVVTVAAVVATQDCIDHESPHVRATGVGRRGMVGRRWTLVCCCGTASTSSPICRVQLVA